MLQFNRLGEIVLTRGHKLFFVVENFGKLALKNKPCYPFLSEATGHSKSEYFEHT